MISLSVAERDSLSFRFKRVNFDYLMATRHFLDLKPLLVLWLQGSYNQPSPEFWCSWFRMSMRKNF